MNHESGRLQATNEPLRLAPHDEVPLGYVFDLGALLRAIDRTMPRGAVVCFEGTSIAPDVVSFLRSKQARHSPPIAPNTLGPNNRFFHLPLSGSNLSELRVLAGHHAGPEIADHLVIYQDRQVLLWAGDAGNGFISISRHLPKDVLKAFREDLGAALVVKT